MTDTYLQRWAVDPEGGALWTDRRDELLAHDQGCPSLTYAWYPRRKGSVCPSDLSNCEDCNVVFFYEGLGLYETTHGDVELCACCARERGFT